MVQKFMSRNDPPEILHVINDEKSGLSGIIAIHSTALGPAAGGCRLWHYETNDAVAIDAMRLARGMSYKNALAGLPFGGGKAVLRRPQGNFDRNEIFRVFSEAVAALEGKYITAEDVGTTIEDMKVVRGRTSYVAGLEPKPGKAGGDPSPWTALGIFQSMQVAANYALRSELAGLTVAVQGVGNVGAHLCRLVKSAGGRLIIADMDSGRASHLANEIGAEIVAVDQIMEVKVDIFAPCALGGILNDKTIPKLKAHLICGGANNQLATDTDGEMLRSRGIVYAPDYLVNAGGIINVAAEYLGETNGQVRQRIDLMSERLLSVLSKADRQCKPSATIADEMAEQIIMNAPRGTEEIDELPAMKIA